MSNKRSREADNETRRVRFHEDAPNSVVPLVKLTITFLNEHRYWDSLPNPIYVVRDWLNNPHLNPLDEPMIHADGSASVVYGSRADAETAIRVFAAQA